MGRGDRGLEGESFDRAGIDEAIRSGSPPSSLSIAKQRERRRHATQKVAWKGAGCVLEMKVSALSELASWVIGFGGECKVLDPAELRAMVVEGHKSGMKAQMSKNGYYRCRGEAMPRPLERLDPGCISTMPPEADRLRGRDEEGCLHEA